MTESWLDRFGECDWKETKVANKEQKRGTRETRKPKQAKVKTAPAASSFVVTSGKGPGGSTKK